MTASTRAYIFLTNNLQNISVKLTASNGIVVSGDIIQVNLYTDKDNTTQREYLYIKLDISYNNTTLDALIDLNVQVFFKANKIIEFTLEDYRILSGEGYDTQYKYLLTSEIIIPEEIEETQDQRIITINK